MVGLEIKKYREKAGLTYEQLAEMIGSKGDTIYRFETGKKNPSFPMLEKISKALNCDIDIKFKPKPKPKK